MRLREWRAPAHPRPVFYAETRNQLDALAPCMQQLKQHPFIVLDVRLRSRTVNADVPFPVALAVWISLLFIPVVVRRWIRERGYARLSFRYVFDQHCLAHGTYALWRHFFAAGKASCLVVANDHNVSTRVAVRAAQDFGVPAVYLQHASVTRDFPPLTMDYALLEGEDSFRKYIQAGPPTARVYLVGMPKADRFLAHPRTRAGGVIGICTSQYDNATDVDRLCHSLTGELPGWRIRLRPHPGSGRRTYEDLSRVAIRHSCEFSDSRAEDVATFLNRIDVLVAGESSVHLEAVLCGIDALYYTGAAAARDVYGYSRHGLVGAPITDVRDLAAAIRATNRGSVEELRQRAKFYVDTVGTSHDGASAALVARLLEDICAGGEIRRAGWLPFLIDGRPHGWRVA